MSRLQRVLVICLALSGASLAAEQRSTPDAKVIVAREQQRVKYLASRDIDGLAKMTSPTLSYSHSNGALDGREKYLADLRSGQVVYRSMDHRDVTVRFLTPEVAMVNGLSDVQVKAGDQELKMTLRFTVVYVQRDGEWMFEAWHSSRVPS